MEALLDESNSSSEPIVFMALTETWLQSHISDAQVSMKDYLISKCDRRGRGGGVCLYSHHSLPISEVIKFDDGKCQCLMVILSTIKICIVVVYRPPDANKSSFKQAINFIKNNLESRTDDTYQICLTGDLNFPYIDWDLHSVTSGQGINIQESGRNFLQLLAVTMQNQYVHEPTRGKNILDIFCTNNPFLVNSVKVRDTELSDHKLVQVSLAFDFNDRRQSEFIPDRNSFAALDFAKADYDSISKDIREYDWNVTRLDCTFEEFPEVMTKIFLCICQKHVPRRKPRTGKPRKYNALRRKKKRLEGKIAKTFRADVRTRLERKLALVHYEIKEAFNTKKDEAEKSIIQNIKSNPKIFY